VTLPVSQPLKKAEAGGSLGHRNSRLAWATQQDLLEGRKEEGDVYVHIHIYILFSLYLFISKPMRLLM
jgi:hypothetical protein